MTEIKRGLEKVVEKFGLKKYLKKPQRKEIKEIKPSLIDSASFEEARNLDNNGRWKEAADHYYTLFSQVTDPLEKAQAFIKLSQAYINLVAYGFSRSFLLGNKDKIISALSGWDKTFYEAQVLEKLGWINDYLGETKEAITNFSQARQLLSERSKTDDQVLRVYETSNHFLGRQYTILAWQGKDVSNNTAQARRRFKESVQIYEGLKSRGKPDEAAEGFQYAWLTRVDLLENNFTAAEEDLNTLHQLFTEVVKQRPESGVMGYYYLLLGRLKFEQGQYNEAKENFAEALRINSEVVNYSASQADALLGMGLSDYYLKDGEKAREEIKKALLLNPSLLYRGYI